MTIFREVTNFAYPHEAIEVMRENTQGMRSVADELGRFAYFLSLQTLHIESPASRSLAFVLANGEIGADIFPNKKRFADLVNELGYSAPRSVIVEPRSTMGDIDCYTQIAALDEQRPERFCKPLNAARGRGARKFDAVETALLFVEQQKEAYLVQTYEKPQHDWRYILHRDTTQLTNGGQSCWRVMFKVMQPTVTGDGSKTIEALVFEDTDMPASAKQNYMKQHKNALAIVPAKGEVVQLVHTGNRAQGAYRQPHTAVEERNLDRFMARFLNHLEIALGTLGTLCVDLGVKDSAVLSGDYDFKKVKDNVVFYEHQMPFGMKPYLQAMPSETRWDRTDSFVPRAYRRRYVEAQVYAGFVRSVLRSGKFLREHKI